MQTWRKLLEIFSPRSAWGYLQPLTCGTYCRSIECTGILDEAQHDPEQKRIKHVFGRKRFWSKKRALVIWCFWLQCFFLLSWNPLHLISIQPYVASGDAIWVICQSLALEAKFLVTSWWSVQKETGRSRVEIPFGTWWFVTPQRALNLYVNILDTYTVYTYVFQLYTNKFTYIL